MRQCKNNLYERSRIPQAYPAPDSIFLSQPLNFFRHQFTVIAVDDCIFPGNNPLLVQLNQACIHRYHPFLLGGGDHIVDLVYLRLPDHVPNSVVEEHNLKCRLYAAI